MPVTVIWSSTNGGSSLSTPTDYGNVANGDYTAIREIFVRHNGANNITSVGFYIATTDSLEYGADFTATEDKNTLISWGNASSSDSFGGYQINQNQTGGFPNASWPTFANKNTVDGFGFTCRTGVGDGQSNLIVLSTNTGATSTGVLQAGSAPNVSFSSRILIPDNYGILGTKQFTLKIAFTSTS